MTEIEKTIKALYMRSRCSSPLLISWVSSFDSLHLLHLQASRRESKDETQEMSKDELHPDLMQDDQRICGQACYMTATPQRLPISNTPIMWGFFTWARSILQQHCRRDILSTYLTYLLLKFNCVILWARNRCKSFKIMLEIAEASSGSSNNTSLQVEEAPKIFKCSWSEFELMWPFAWHQWWE